MQTVGEISRAKVLNQEYFIFDKLNINTSNHPINIMIIDDSKKDIELFEELLSFHKGLNFTLSKWTNSHEAIIALEYGQVTLPDLIVLDLIMPSMNGKMILKRLKEIAKVKKIPVIIHSSMGNLENVRSAQSLDANAFFAKPLNASVFSSYLKGKQV